PPAAPSPLSLHDALPIWTAPGARAARPADARVRPGTGRAGQHDPDRRLALELTAHARRCAAVHGLGDRNRDASHARGTRDCPRTDRKSTRLNSSHVAISY